ncbi:MAG: glucosamine-6-phosphate deaminase [Anaerolineaceae bacterium]
MGPQITVASPETFGLAACRELLALASAFEAPLLGLATGYTPIPLYEVLREHVRLGEISLARFRPPFAIDEYVVPDAAHSCANRAFFARHWGAIPTTHPVHQFDPSAPDLLAEASRFAAQLKDAGGLDVVILGIGMNGHLAFNEPGTERGQRAMLTTLTSRTRASATACFGAAPPTHGLTLGLAEILSARRVLLLAMGEKKAEIVAQALERTVSSTCPASFLQEHPHCSVVLDTAAAARLTRTLIRPA